MSQGPLDPHSLPHVETERQQLAQQLHVAARQAFHQQHARLATLTICDALMLYPNERSILNSFDEIALAQADPLLLFPVQPGAVHVATAAGRARVLMMSNRLPEALELLGQVLLAAPTLGYLDWIRRWLAQPLIVAKLPWALLSHSVVIPALRMIVSVEVPVRPDDRRLPSVHSACAIFRTLLERFRDEAELHNAWATALRRLGDPNAAVSAAEDGVRRFPRDARLRITFLHALGDAGRADDAHAQARFALQLDAENPTPLYEVAQIFLKQGRSTDAIPLLQELLARHPGFADADACLHFARFKTIGHADHYRALMHLRDRRPHSKTVQLLADAIDPEAPFVNTLPGPSDALARAVRPLLAELEPVFRACRAETRATFTVRSTSPTAPSAQLAFALAAGSAGAMGATLAVCTDHSVTPDLHADKGPVPLPIFRLEQGGVLPVLSRRRLARATRGRTAGVSAISQRSLGSDGAPAGQQLGPRSVLAISPW